MNIEIVNKSHQIRQAKVEYVDKHLRIYGNVQNFCHQQMKKIQRRLQLALSKAQVRQWSDAKRALLLTKEYSINTMVFFGYYLLMRKDASISQTILDMTEDTKKTVSVISSALHFILKGDTRRFCIRVNRALNLVERRNAEIESVKRRVSENDLEDEYFEMSEEEIRSSLEKLKAEVKEASKHIRERRI